MKWSSLATFVSILIPVMVILDAATIYKLGKIKDFQIRVWYALSNMKPHYSASNITSSVITYLTSLKTRCGRLFFIYCFIVAILYVLLSFYFGASILGRLGGLNENLFLDIFFRVTQFNTVFPYIVIPIVFIHAVFMVLSVYIIIFVHRKISLRGKLISLLGFLLSLFLVSIADIIAISFDYWYSMLMFNVIANGSPFVDFFRGYLLIPLFATPFLIAPTLITFMLSIFLTLSWVVVFPAKELAERVFYVQASNDKQGLFTYLAGFISAVVALANGIYKALW